MKRYLLYWFIGYDVHIETYDELSDAISRKKEVETYIFYFDDSDVFLFELYDFNKRRMKMKIAPILNLYNTMNIIRNHQRLRKEYEEKKKRLAKIKKEYENGRIKKTT